MAESRRMWTLVRESATILDPKAGMRVKIACKMNRELPWAGSNSLYSRQGEGEGVLDEPILGNGGVAFFVRHDGTGSFGAYWLDELEEIKTRQ